MRPRFAQNPPGWGVNYLKMFNRVSVRTASEPLSTAMAFAAVVGVSLAVMTGPAVAQARANAQADQDRSARERIFTRNLPPSGRYVAESGHTFLLDRSGTRILMRFERSSEIWVLRPTPAPRGDMIYRNDAGEQVLRVTPDGAMTLFTSSAPQGAPVSNAGPGPALSAPTLTPVQLWNYIVRQSGRASAALGRLVQVDVDIRPGSEAVAADALTTAVDAVIRMARSSNLREEASQVRRIVITDTGRPGVGFGAGTLRIVINAEAGLAGRPSSARIVRVVAARD